jgi:hypothetical protein
LLNENSKIYGGEAVNSYELRSPEFPRTPSAARPEYFTVFSGETKSRTKMTTSCGLRKLRRTTFSGVSSYSFRFASGILHNFLRLRLRKFSNSLRLRLRKFSKSLIIIDFQVSHSFLDISLISRFACIVDTRFSYETSSLPKIRKFTENVVRSKLYRKKGGD